MSATADDPALVAATQADVATAHAGRVPLRAAEVGCAALLFAVLCALLAYSMGRDLNWDYFNYHAYAGFDPFGRRLGQDFFPAAFQAYMNRLAYLPLGLMDGAGWHSLATACVIAAGQSLNLLFLYLIARELTHDALRPRLVAAIVTVLGGATNLFLQQLGSTFVDPLTTPPLMAALWIMVRRPSWRWTPALAGLLAGAAVALKLTNVPFAPALLGALLCIPGPLRTRLHRAAWGGLACGLGFLLLDGYWAFRLWQEFSSPVYPIANNLFRSPDFLPVALSYHRFVPHSLAEVLALPLAITETRSWVYSEGLSPDVRPLLLQVLFGLWLLCTAWRRLRGGAARGHDARAPVAPALPVLGIFFAIGCVGWLLTSGNGRYATPLLLLIGPLLYALSASLLNARGAAMACTVVLAVQTLVIWGAGNPRWTPADWTATWLPGSVPDSLKAQPFLYVATSTSSESYLASFVHPESVFVNPIGQVSMPTGGPGWERFVRIRDRFVGRTKVFFTMPSSSDEEVDSLRIGAMGRAVERLGLRIEGNCTMLRFNTDPASLRFPWRGFQDAATKPRQVALCDALPLTAPDPERQAIRARVTRVMDAFERKCPKLFAPNGVAVEGAFRMWARMYGTFDVLLTIDADSGDIVYRMERQPVDSRIGNLSTWERDLAAFDCRLPLNGRRDIGTLGGADALR